MYSAPRGANENSKCYEHAGKPFGHCSMRARPSAFDAGGCRAVYLESGGVLEWEIE